jgi:hypothetical protein
MRLLLALLLAPAAAAQTPPATPSAADLEVGIAHAIEQGAAKALAALENGAIDVRRLGAACDGVNTDADTPAFRSALARAALRPYGATIRVPAGRCLLSESLSATLMHNQALSIEGAGADVSELVFTTDTDGVAVTLASANAWLRTGTTNLSGALFHMAGLSLVRGIATEGRNAVTVSNTAAVNPGSRQVQLENIVVRGDGAGGNFQNGIVLNKVSTALVDNFYFHAAYRAGSTGAGIVMSSAAGFNGGGLNVTRTEIEYAQTCYRLGEYLQGITISNSSCVGAQDGIVASSASLSNDLIASTTSHWDVRHSVVTSNGWSSLTFVNNYLLANDPAASNDFIAFDLRNGARHHFTGNHILGRGDSTGMRFLRISNTTAFDSQMSADVVGNAADGMTGEFVTIAGQTANAMVIGNFCNTCGTLGSDARGLSRFASNSINGEMMLAGTTPVNGAVMRPGTGATNGRYFFGAFGIDGSDGSTEIGRPSATGTPRIDFHTSGNPARAYDSRIIGFGGAGRQDGSGNLAVIARTTELYGQLSVANCPSSPAGLRSGALWCNGTVVNRVP